MDDSLDKRCIQAMFVPSPPVTCQEGGLANGWEGLVTEIIRFLSSFWFAPWIELANGKVSLAHAAFLPNAQVCQNVVAKEGASTRIKCKTSMS